MGYITKSMKNELLKTLYDLTLKDYPVIGDFDSNKGPNYRNLNAVEGDRSVYVFVEYKVTERDYERFGMKLVKGVDDWVLLHPKEAESILLTIISNANGMEYRSINLSDTDDSKESNKLDRGVLVSKLYALASSRFPSLTLYSSNQHLKIEDVSVYKTTESMFVVTNFKVTMEDSQTFAMKKDLNGGDWVLVSQDFAEGLIKEVLTDRETYRKVEVTDSKMGTKKTEKRNGLRPVLYSRNYNMAHKKVGYFHKLIEVSGILSAIIETENGELIDVSIHGIKFLDV